MPYYIRRMNPSRSSQTYSAFCSVCLPELCSSCCSWINCLYS
uniref:Uncharacterized protein n=1 Tax=Mesocestoides corti TaxID=53468 RepID=A0A5K3G1M4_MESCO